MYLKGGFSISLHINSYGAVTVGILEEKVQCGGVFIDSWLTAAQNCMKLGYIYLYFEDRWRCCFTSFTVLQHLKS